MELCVGLFGTCGQSRWRDPFTAHYQELEIPFFNPQVDDWEPELANLEAHHLANDDIVLFPITGETYGTGSLAECGFSILNAIKLESQRDFVIMIEAELNASLNDPVARRESLRARALVKQHLLKLRLRNLYLVDDLPTMLEVSLVLFEAAKLRSPLRQLNPHNIQR
jgi:hypothetical protein